MSDDHLDRQLEQMSGSPALARELRASLRRLADGAAGRELAEMARDVLAGRSSLREVARSSAYADQITEAVGRYQRWEAALTPQERDRFVDQSRARILGGDESSRQ